MENGRINNDNHFARLQLSPNKTLVLDTITVQTVDSALLVNGSCDGRITITSASHRQSASFAFPINPMVLNFVSLRDIDVTSGSAIANNVVVLGGNCQGWTLNASTPQTYYWIGGSNMNADWGNPANWSTSSGGASNPGACLPSALDDVVFDAASFTPGNAQVRINITGARCHNMTWSNVSNSPAFTTVSTVNAGFNCYGSLEFDANMSTDLRGPVTFSGSGIHTIRMRGQKFSHNLTFDSPTGNWTFLDDMYVEGPGGNTNLNGAGAGRISLVCGRLNTNGVNVRANCFSSINTNPRELYLGASYITLVGRDVGTSYEAWFFGNYTNLTFDAGTSTIEITDGNRSPSLGIFFASGQIFHNVLFSHPNATAVVHGSNRINNLTFRGNGRLGRVSNPSNNTIDSLIFSPGKTYTFRNSALTRLGYLEANGDCSKRIYLKSSALGIPAIWETISGVDTITATGMIIQDNYAQSGTFIANSSVTIPVTSGWTLTPATGLDFYWVGGTGMWGDTAHWALTSGDTTTPNACLPGPKDNVFFDANSFYVNGETVTIDVNTAYCHNMDWSGATGTPTFTFNGSFQLLRIFGSLTLIPQMTTSLSGVDVYFNGSGATFPITSAGQILPDVFFNSLTGTWSLSDALRTANFWLNAGTVRSNNQMISINSFISRNNSARTLDLGSSLVLVRAGSTLNLSSRSWNSSGLNFNLEEGTSLIRFTAANLPSMTVTPDTFYDIEFSNPAATARLYNSNVYHKVTFAGNGQI
ncbi:MAG TPA: hypothetical protein ENJ82_00145, partial [Bacteroidetes bacterium]|nr:hypothetical protein [Bacteroidota bacterium]